MPGRARSKEIYRVLQALADDEGHETALDYVCAWVERGRTIEALAGRLEGSFSWPLHLHSIRRALTTKHALDDIVARLDEARKQGAHVLLDQSLDIVDDVKLPMLAEARDHISLAKVRSDKRTELAGYWNPTLRPKGAGDVNVNVTLGDAHLAFLQKRQMRAQVAEAHVETPPMAQLPTGGVEDAEVTSPSTDE